MIHHSSTQGNEHPACTQYSLVDEGKFQEMPGKQLQTLVLHGSAVICNCRQTLSVLTNVKDAWSMQLCNPYVR